ncbi:MAG: PadR family transcriptional regulator [Candidatus Eiseniibacteriota bacterium]|jgi:DNA-binding PadR family transcriptional regulator
MKPHLDRGRRQLTELEGAVLGEVARDGPCTAYRVRMAFAGSPSAVWSGSAGAIYPLLRRLEERGLVVSRAVRQGRRAGRTYALSRTGRAALQRWLADAGAAVDPGFDPLRTRGLYLSRLPADRRQRFLAGVRQGLETQRQQLRAELRAETHATRDDALAARSVILQIQAKLRWLDEVERAGG